MSEPRRVHLIRAGFLMLTVMLLLPFGYGCKRSLSSGIFLSIQVPIFNFMQSQSDSKVNGHVYDFPALEVFSSSGRLVYMSHNASANAKLLQSLPTALNHLDTIPNQPELAANLQHLPRLSEENKRALEANHLPTVLAFTLEECNACTIQENALNPDGARRLAQLGINTLFIEVLR